MRKSHAIVVVVSCILAIYVAALGSSLTYGEGPGVWSSGFQVLNVGSEAASVFVQWYDLDGNIVHSETFSLDPQEMTNFPPGYAAVPDGFEGSVIVASSEPVISTVNQRNNVGGGVEKWGNYNGTSSPGSSVYLPLIMKANYGWSTWFAVQNAGSAPADVTVDFVSSATGSTVYTTSATIPVGASAYFDQDNDDNLPSGFVGSVVLSGDQPLAAAVNEETINANTLLSYHGGSAGGNTVHLPLIMEDNSGWYTGFRVQNQGTATATVRATFYERATGDPVYTTPDTLIGPKASHGWLQRPTLGTYFVGSVMVESLTGAYGQQPIVVNVNEFGPGDMGMAYSGFVSGTSQINLPLIMHNNGGWYTGFSVMNIGTGATDITAFFYPRGETTPVLTKTATIDSGGSVGFLQSDGEYDVLGPNWVGAVKVTSTGEPIVATVNEMDYALSGDGAMVYNGFNR